MAELGNKNLEGRN